MRRRLTVFALAALVAACGSSGGDQATAPDASAPAPAEAASAPAEAPTAPDDATASDAGASTAAPAEAPLAVLTTVGGGQIDAGALEGRDLALWFWAPW